MKLYYIEGAKNTFVLLSGLGLDFKTKEKSFFESIRSDSQKLSMLAKKLCLIPKVSVDGCIFVFESDKLHDFKWEFFNSDGSEASMCGNAARAVSLWFYKFINKKKEINFSTTKQNVRAKILEIIRDEDQTLNNEIIGEVSVFLLPTKYIGLDNGHRIYDSGVPHLCVYVNEGCANDEHLTGKEAHFESIKSKYYKEAQSLRFPALLDSKGSNVTYIWKGCANETGVNSINAVSFERGVENWTAACGTGAMAAAYFACDELDFSFPVQVNMPGGVLIVNKSDTSTNLTGQAKINQIIDINIGELI